MKKIHKILIANRGEIAVRIIKTCDRLGIRTVLAASEADLDSLAARLANETICIGKARSSESYLCVDKVIGAAVEGGVDALHPGYGFLSENKQLAAECERKGIIFIGPTVEQLDAVGDKLKARHNAIAAGMPVVPGGEITEAKDAEELIKTVGFPVLIKAVSGGGGRGMKIVHDSGNLHEMIEMAISEAQAAFGDPRVYLERFVTSGRHVEVQVLGDGNTAIHLGTRDCSVQRRYQKLLEEAPAPCLSDALREQMHEAAVNFAEYLNYRGLGTVELLVDCERETFYFLEMNARIQVEHPVTEAVCGLDLVEEQVWVAEGRPLRFAQDDILISGHAFECRINAENWLDGFSPSPGKVTRATFPVGDGIRMDTHIQGGAFVPPFYDSLVGKLIVHGDSREEALAILRKALKICSIEGIDTNLAMHSLLSDDTGFIDGGIDTAYFSKFLERVTEG